MFSSSHPYSAVSVHIENLTADDYEEDDYSGIPDLIEVIKLQGTGATEAARAIRKKLKYANVQRQLRALTILDGLVQNGGQRLQRSLLSDQPLLERLKIAAVDPMSDTEVREKCKILFSEWMAASKQNEGLKGAADLYNRLPHKKTGTQQRREQSRVLRETEEAAQREVESEEEEEYRPRTTKKYSGEPSSPAPRKSSIAQSTPTTKATPSYAATTTSSASKVKVKKFKLEKERPNIYQAIAQSSVAATDLSNAIKRVNRERSRVSDDKDVMRTFERCKNLRRQILRYIQLVETDEFLGSLIHANEELVTALMAFEVLDKSLEDDSDSEMEEAQHLSREAARIEALAQKEAERAIKKMTIREQNAAQARRNRPAAITPSPPRSPSPVEVVQPKTKKAAAPPPRPSVAPPKSKAKARRVEPESESEQESDDNPFGDQNVINTPDPDKFKKGYTWKEV